MAVGNLSWLGGLEVTLGDDGFPTSGPANTYPLTAQSWWTPQPCRPRGPLRRQETRINCERESARSWKSETPFAIARPFITPNEPWRVAALAMIGDNCCRDRNSEDFYSVGGQAYLVRSASALPDRKVLD
jgi:hypothetical protein